MVMDAKFAILLLPFDFSKAFKTIPTSKLLNKLRFKVSLSMALFISLWSLPIFSKLSTSKFCDTNLGPQGFVLGPLLFFTCINDLRTLLDDGTTLRLLHAHESQIYAKLPAH